MENKVFTYTYSASVNKEIQEIRKKYLPREADKLETLRELDRHVQSAGILQGLTLGVIGCLIFGTGICAGLGVIGGGMILALILGSLGIAVMLPAYFVYRAMSIKAKKEYSPMILRLAEEIENGNKKS